MDTSENDWYGSKTMHYLYIILSAGCLFFVEAYIVALDLYDTTSPRVIDTMMSKRSTLPMDVVGQAH